MGDRTSSSTVIKADKSKIMTVIADFPAYPTWADGIKAAEIVSTGEGGRAEQVRFRLDAGPMKDTYVLAYVWEGDDAVRWDMSETGKMISKMSGSYRLTEQDGGTEVTYELAVEASLLKVEMMRRRIEKMITGTALKDLKLRVEK